MDYHGAFVLRSPPKMTEGGYLPEELACNIIRTWIRSFLDIEGPIILDQNPKRLDNGCLLFTLLKPKRWEVLVWSKGVIQVRTDS